jgi:hypothetical protein
VKGHSVATLPHRKSYLLNQKEENTFKYYEEKVQVLRISQNEI